MTFGYIGVRKYGKPRRLSLYVKDKIEEVLEDAEKKKKKRDDK